MRRRRSGHGVHGRRRVDVRSSRNGGTTRLRAPKVVGTAPVSSCEGRGGRIRAGVGAATSNLGEGEFTDAGSNGGL